MADFDESFVAISDDTDITVNGESYDGIKVKTSDGAFKSTFCKTFYLINR